MVLVFFVVAVAAIHLLYHLVRFGSVWFIDISAVYCAMHFATVCTSIVPMIMAFRHGSIYVNDVYQAPFCISYTFSFWYSHVCAIISWIDVSV